MQKKNATERTNLFCATRTGQIRHILALIEQFEIQNCTIILMYTDMDNTLLENMKKTIPSGVFKKVIYCELPAYPASRTATLVKRKRVYENIEASVNKAIDGDLSVDLYLCHVNNYYIFFTYILDEANVDYRLNLVEEGLSTYKWGMTSKTWGPFNWSEEHDGVVDSRSFKLYAKKSFNSGKALIKSILLFWVPIVKALRRFILDCGLLVLTLSSSVTRKNLLSGMSSLGNHITPKKYRYALIQEFENGYFCFPGKMKRVHEFKIKQLHRLNFETSQKNSKDHKNTSFDLTPNNIPLFASQRYGDYEMYYRAVFDVFEKMGLVDVYFKFHPREEVLEVRELFEAEARKHPTITIWHDSEFDGISVEELLEKKSFTSLIGLTTSALLYCYIMPVETKPISIVEEFERTYRIYSEKENSVTVDWELKELARDYLIFKEVATEVKQFHASEKGHRHV